MKRFFFSFFFFCAIYGVAQQRPGSGHALGFNSSNQYVSLNSSFGSVSLPVSISVWVKPNSTNADQRIFYSHTQSQSGAYQGFWMHVLNGDLVAVFADGAGRGQYNRRSARGSVNLQANRWYHLTGVIRGATNMSLYVNGLPISFTYDGSGGPLSGDNSNGSIGWGFFSGPNSINGEIDELSIWSKALTQVEVRDMMCQKLTGNEPGLMAYYRFDHTAGNTLSNIVSGAPDGTLVNSPTWVASSAPVGDRSYHNDYITGVDAKAASLSGDSVIVHPSHAGSPGTHIYMVDTKPTNTAGINPVLGIDYYFGVFNTEYNRVYDLNLFPAATTASFPNNTLVLAKRPHNASPAWTPTTHANNPNFFIPGETPISQYVIALAGCPPTNFFPADTTACDSVWLDIGSGYTNISWSNGHTTSGTAFFASGQVWVQATEAATGCVVSDIIDLTVLQSGNLPSLSLDTTVCGATSYTHDITTSGATSYQWYNGATGNRQSFSQSGSYWYAITYGTGCTAFDTLNLSLAPLTDEPVEDTIFYICSDDTVEVQLSSNTFPQVLWSNGATTWNTYYHTTGKKWVTTQNADGCWQTDSFEIMYNPALSNLRIFNDTSVCAGEVLYLEAPGELSATWPNGSHGIYPVSSSQNIRVELSDGCTQSIEYFEVKEYSCDCNLVFPNAFTPDGDGLNDYFGPATKCEFLHFDMQVFNRYGQRVFHTMDAGHLFDGTWKGEDLPLGVYVYIFTYRTPYTKGTERGYLTLIR